MTDNKKIIVCVAYNPDNNTYSVDIPSGESVHEVAFGVSVVIKCLVRDKVIENNEYFTDLVHKYLNDPQFAELKDKKKKSKKGGK